MLIQNGLIPSVSGVLNGLGPPLPGEGRHEAVRCVAQITPGSPFYRFGRSNARGPLSLRCMFLYAGGQMKVRTRANMEKGGDNMTIGRHHGHEEKTGTSSRPARPGLLTQNMCAIDRDSDHPYKTSSKSTDEEDSPLL